MAKKTHLQAMLDIYNAEQIVAIFKANGVPVLPIIDSQGEEVLIDNADDKMAAPLSDDELKARQYCCNPIVLAAQEQTDHNLLTIQNNFALISMLQIVERMINVDQLEQLPSLRIAVPIFLQGAKGKGHWLSMTVQLDGMNQQAFANLKAKLAGGANKTYLGKLADAGVEDLIKDLYSNVSVFVDDSLETDTFKFNEHKRELEQSLLNAFPTLGESFSLDRQSNLLQNDDRCGLHTSQNGIARLKTGNPASKKDSQNVDEWENEVAQQYVAQQIPFEQPADSAISAARKDSSASVCNPDQAVAFLRKRANAEFELQEREPRKKFKLRWWRRAKSSGENKQVAISYDVSNPSRVELEGTTDKDMFMEAAQKSMELILASQFGIDGDGNVRMPEKPELAKLQFDFKCVETPAKRKWFIEACGKLGVGYVPHALDRKAGPGDTCHDEAKAEEADLQAASLPAAALST